MIRPLSPLHRVLPLAVALVVAASISVPAPASAATACQTTSSAVLKTNSKAEKQAKELLRDNSYTPVVRSYVPQPTSTEHFNGYETITVKAPKGTAPVVGYFTVKGGEACSVVVTSAQVVLSRNAYLVKLKFPGEQGNPGKLTVTLISR